MTMAETAKTTEVKPVASGRTNAHSKRPRSHNAQPSRHAGILSLQSAAGNQATSHLLHANDGGPSVSQIPPIIQSTLSGGGGHPLDSVTRAEMESRFGQDFSQVRVHTDEQAVESARAVDAAAYSVGNDVAFDHGKYAPDTPTGKHLLAHELAHVVQQSRGGLATPSQNPNSPLEQAADSAASAFTQSAATIQVGGSSAVGLSRQLNSEQSETEIIVIQVIDVSPSGKETRRPGKLRLPVKKGLSSWERQKLILSAIADWQAPKVTIDFKIPVTTFEDVWVGESKEVIVRIGAYWIDPSKQKKAPPAKPPANKPSAPKPEKAPEPPASTGAAQLPPAPAAPPTELKESQAPNPSLDPTKLDDKRLADETKRAEKWLKDNPVSSSESYQTMEFLEALKQEEKDRLKRSSRYKGQNTLKEVIKRETGINPVMPEEKVPEVKQHVETPADLIKGHTRFLTVEDDDLGAALLARANQGKYGLVQRTLDQLNWTTRDNVALAFLKKASDEELERIDSFPEGRKLLSRIFDELSVGSLNEEEQAEGRRLLELRMRRRTPEDYHAAKSKAKIFPFSLPGLTKGKVSPIEAERLPNGKIRVRLYGYSKWRSKSLPDAVFFGSGIELDEDEIVGIKDYEEGEITYYLPALYLLQLANQTDSTYAQKFAETVGLAATLGTGALVGGGAKAATWGARTVVWADRAAFVADIAASVIREHRGEFIKAYGDSGRRFLSAVDAVSSVVMIYGMARAITGVPGLFRNLRGTYKDWRALAQMRRELSEGERLMEQQLTRNTQNLLREFELQEFDPNFSRSQVKNDVTLPEPPSPAQKINDPHLWQGKIGNDVDLPEQGLHAQLGEVEPQYRAQSAANDMEEVAEAMASGDRRVRSIATGTGGSKGPKKAAKPAPPKPFAAPKSPSKPVVAGPPPAPAAAVSSAGAIPQQARNNAIAYAQAKGLGASAPGAAELYAESLVRQGAIPQIGKVDDVVPGQFGNVTMPAGAVPGSKPPVGSGKDLWAFRGGDPLPVEIKYRGSGSDAKLPRRKFDSRGRPINPERGTVQASPAGDRNDWLRWLQHNRKKAEALVKAGVLKERWTKEIWVRNMGDAHFGRVNNRYVIVISPKGVAGVDAASQQAARLSNSQIIKLDEP